MDEANLFSESHRELMGLISWMNKPVILVERGSLDDQGLDQLIQGDIVSTRNNAGITTLRQGLPQEIINKVVECFLDSHRKLLEQKGER